MDAIELSLFVKRINAVCEEMGSVLMRTAFSPNIKDRLDFSCAIFDAGGQLCAQAAHIPVHPGSTVRVCGKPGQTAINLLHNKPVPGKTEFKVVPGDRLTIR